MILSPLRTGELPLSYLLPSYQIVQVCGEDDVGTAAVRKVLQ